MQYENATKQNAPLEILKELGQYLIGQARLVF